MGHGPCEPPAPNAFSQRTCWVLPKIGVMPPCWGPCALLLASTQGWGPSNMGLRPAGTQDSGHTMKGGDLGATPGTSSLSPPAPQPTHGSPELALEGADFSVHGVGRLRGVLQLPLELPAGRVGPLRLLLGLLQLPLKLLQAGGRLVGLRRPGPRSAAMHTRFMGVPGLPPRSPPGP